MKQNILKLLFIVLLFGSNQIVAQNASFVINNAGVVTTFCEGECITVTDQSTPAGNIVAWTWSITSSLPSFSASIQYDSSQDPGTICFHEAGSYVLNLDILDGNGAIDSFNIAITIVSSTTCLKAGFTYKTPICIGECITVTDTSSGGPPVMWDWTIFVAGSNIPATATIDNSTIPNPEICFPVAGDYEIYLLVTDADGKISATFEQTITIVPLPTVTAGIDTIIELGQSIILGAVSPDLVEYSWRPDEYIRNPNSETPFARPEITTEYIVTATDVNGCIYEDTMIVYVNFQPGIGVPTAFSPNADGNNDLLAVEGMALSKVVFKVYNRYGQLVFESVEQKNGWDGNFKGKPENPGVFLWTLEYEFNTGQLGKLSGNTTLVR